MELFKLTGIIIMIFSGFVFGSDRSHTPPMPFAPAWYKIYWLIRGIATVVATFGVPVFFGFKYSWWYLLWAPLLGVTGMLILIQLMKLSRINSASFYSYVAIFYLMLCVLFVVLL